MKRLAFLCLLVCLAVPAGPMRAGDDDSITMIGLDEKGSPVESIMKKREYTERLAAISTAVNESAVVAMSRQENKASWGLRTLAVGIGVGLEAGLGPIIKVKMTPRFRLIFSNLAEPILP